MSWNPISSLTGLARKRRGRRRLAFDALEDRRLLSLGVFSENLAPAGVTVDAAGNVYVSHMTSTPLYAAADTISVYASTGALLASTDIQNSGLAFTGGSLLTLASYAGASSMGLQTGDILHLAPTGEVWAIKPIDYGGQIMKLLDLRMFFADASSIYDVQYRGYSGFGGVIMPESATFGDIAAYNGKILVTGVSNGVPFVLRYDFRTGESKVVLSSRVTQGIVLNPDYDSSIRGGHSVGAPGIAVNSQGLALTTLAVTTTDNAALGVIVPVAFGVNFDHGVGTMPLPLVNNGGDPIGVDSRGMTVDGNGNFLISTSGVSTTLGDMYHGVVIVRSDLASVSFRPLSSDFLTYASDVAVNPRGTVLYEAWGNRGKVVYDNGYSPPSAPPSNPGSLQLEGSSLSVSESAGELKVVVRRVGGSSGSVSVHYATSDSSATGGSDFTAQSATLTFDAGETLASFRIPITGDDGGEPDETFTIRLSNPGGGATLGNPTAATVTIKDGDGPEFVGQGDFNFVGGRGAKEFGTLALAVDRWDNLYWGGFLRGDADLAFGDPDEFWVRDNGHKAGFLLKYTSQVKAVWGAVFQGTADVYVNGAAVDDSGNVYTLLNFQGTADVDPGSDVVNLTAASEDDVVLVKLDPDGQFVWVRELVDQDYSVGRGLAVDSHGNVIVAVEPPVSVSQIDADPGSGVAMRATSGSFIVKLNPDGNLLWADAPSGTPNKITGLTVDQADNVLVVGEYEQSALDLDPGPGSATVSGGDVFVWKLDASGKFVWGKTFGGADVFNVAHAYDIAADPLGQVYLTGRLIGRVDLDAGPAVNLQGTGTRDVHAYTMKLDANGGTLWSAVLGNGAYPNEASGDEVVVDHRGNVVTAGTFEGTMDVDPSPDVYRPLTAPVSTHEFQIFISTLDKDGKFVEGIQEGGPDYEDVRGLVIDGGGAVTIAGNYLFRTQIGGSKLGNMALEMSYIARMAARAPVISAIPDQVADEGDSLHVPARAVYAADGRSIVYSLAPGAPSGMTVDQGGNLTWVAAGGPAELDVTVIAADSADPSRRDSSTFHIRVNKVAPSDPDPDSGAGPSRPGGTGSTPAASSPQPVPGGGPPSPSNPSPPVAVSTVQLVRRKGAVNAVVLNLSGEPDLASVGSLANYSLVQAGRDKRFGTKDDVKFKLRSVVYNPSTHALSLKFKRKLRLNATARLTIRGLRGMRGGRGVDGDRDGQPDALLTAYLSRRGVNFVNG